MIESVAFDPPSPGNFTGGSYGNPQVTAELRKRPSLAVHRGPRVIGFLKWDSGAE